MTISREHIPSDIYAGKVLCTGEGHRYAGTHLIFIHNGYGEDKHPLTEEQWYQMEGVVQRHEKETFGTHSIRILYIHP